MAYGISRQEPSGAATDVPGSHPPVSQVVNEGQMAKDVLLGIFF